ncbi:unnamed protein product [Merluccius merluccius]
MLANTQLAVSEGDTRRRTQVEPGDTGVRQPTLNTRSRGDLSATDPSQAEERDGEEGRELKGRELGSVVFGGFIKTTPCWGAEGLKAQDAQSCRIAPVKPPLVIFRLEKRFSSEVFLAIIKY